MKRFVPIAAAAASACCLMVLVMMASSWAGGPETPSKHYVCSPCGLPCDAAVYDKPGVCPKCGMPLVEQAEAAARIAAAPARRKVAILIFDGVEIIDYTGPWEMLGAAGFDVYTVAATKDVVTTAMGMSVVPKYTFDDAPQPDLLLVPGGGVRAAQTSAPTLAWVRKTSAGAASTLSVCNGAFILAAAGLLDGLDATTTAGNIDRMRAAFPKVNVVDDQRVVDNGRIVTAAGLSAGIDGALHVIERLIGKGAAQQVALGEEYDWRPDGGFVRAALADRLIPDLDLDAIGSWSILSTQGGVDRWEIVARGATTLSPADVAERIGRGLETGGKWARAGAGASQPAAAPGAAITSDWTFSGRDGRPWTGRLTLQPAPDGDHACIARLAIARAG